MTRAAYTHVDACMVTKAAGRRRRGVARAWPGRAQPGAVALAVGLIYVFRTAAGGHYIMRELEGAVRKYAADPQALWRLVRDGEGGQGAAPRGEVIEGSVAEPKQLDERDSK